VGAADNSIAGDYQFRAASADAPSVQRFWHHAKILAIDRYLPPAADDSILDVGCGSGVVSSHVAATAARVIGVDGNRNAVDFAAVTFRKPNLRFVHAAVDDLPAAPGSVDKIYCLEVIEHLDAPVTHRMLEAFRTALKPGGRAFLTTPNVRSAWPVIEWLVDRSGRAPRMAGEQHVEMYNRGKLTRLCAQHGFAVDAAPSMCFLAPWLAPIGWRLAKSCFDLEAALRLPIGSILIVVLRRP
jgi:2-polyprenyl-3-methyl-5-hydroxy-6-metoxy-1,4-benzoquinol methylase